MTANVQIVMVRAFAGNAEPLDAERKNKMIDVCDVVLHAPSGENWVVACVDGDRLYWVGYPYGGSAALSDCQLVTKASDKDRQSLLEKLAELTGFDVPTLRARARLTQRVPDAGDLSQ